MSVNQKRDLGKIIPIALIWAGGGLLYSFIEYGILGNSTIYPSTNNPYQFETSILSSFLSSLAIGLIIGLIETKIDITYFVTKKFWQKIVFKTVLYISLIIILLLSSLLLLFSSRLNVSLFHAQTLQSILQFVGNFSFWSIIIYAAAITIFSLFITEVSDYLGGGVFNNFFTGKYHNPIEEERVFMFLDMNSSTTIAEKLGHKEYFKLLRKYYADLTEAIIQTKGEIYQYAGDEVIVSWNLEKGLQYNNYINCFFMITDIFQESSEAYIARFGLVPKFKAGFHCGSVTTGEIGVLKKEVFFTGDVLNTTARIQTSCKQYKTDILISKVLLSQQDITNEYETIAIGECQLKGRNEKIDLFTIKRK